MSWNALEMYTNGLEVFTSVVESVGDDGWSRTSPCEGWSALDVLGHVGAATSMGAVILRGGDMAFERLDQPSGLVEGDPATWWRGLATEARDALSSVDDLDREVDSPMGKRTVRDGLSFPAVDLFVHAWDLAASAGQSVTFPDEAVEFIRALFAQVPVEASRRPGVFSAEVAATNDASPTEQVIAFTGRDPGWSGTDAG